VSRQKRRRFTPEQKAAILREHLVDRVPVSDLCERHGIGVPMFYRWQKQMFDSLPGLFQSDPGEKTEKKAEAEVRRLQERLAAKDAVIAEIMGDLIDAKKKTGGRW